MFGVLWGGGGQCPGQCPLNEVLSNIISTSSTHTHSNNKRRPGHRVNCSEGRRRGEREEREERGREGRERWEKGAETIERGEGGRSLAVWSGGWE